MHNTQKLTWKRLLIPRLTVLGLILVAIAILMGPLSAEAMDDTAGNVDDSGSISNPEAEPSARLERMPVSVYYDTVKDGIRAYEDEEFETAFEQNYRTARWGEKTPQFLLAVMYYQGLGTEVDEVEGLAWLILAAESGNPRWIALRDDALENMQPDQVVAGQELGETYRQWYGVEATGMKCGRRSIAGTRTKRNDCWRDKRGNQRNIEVFKEFPI